LHKSSQASKIKPKSNSQIKLKSTNQTKSKSAQKKIYLIDKSRTDTVQRNTNSTTAESKDSDNSRHIIRDIQNSLSSAKLKKRKLNKTAERTPEQQKVSRPSHKLLTPQNNLGNIHSRGQLSVSRRYIKLVDIECAQKKNFIKVETEMKKPGISYEEMDINQRLRQSMSLTKSRSRIYLAKSASQLDRFDEDGEENYVESPCPKVRPPPTTAFKNSLRESGDTPEFTITLQMIDGGCDGSIQQNNYLAKESSEYSSRDSQIFERDLVSEDGDYDLFDWSDEFDLIIAGTHSEVNNEETSGWNIKQITLNEHPKIDIFTKYNVIKEYMGIKATMLRGAKKNIEKPSDKRNKLNISKPKERLYSSFRNDMYNSDKIVIWFLTNILGQCGKET
jgi:hypothetical protein